MDGFFFYLASSKWWYAIPDKNYGMSSWWKIFPSFQTLELELFSFILFDARVWCIFSGEIFELKAELNSDKKDRKKEAVKKVIASMTVGKDVR